MDIINNVIKEAKWINKIAINFYSQDAYDKYMKEHPEADPKNHKVVDSINVKEKLKQVGYDHDKMIQHKETLKKTIGQPTHKKIKDEVDKAYTKLLKKHEELDKKSELSLDDMQLKKIIQDVIPQHKRRFQILKEDKIDPYPQDEYKSYSGDL
jgi:seryl-tRNA synthetase